jgi:hypothetical protein
LLPTPWAACVTPAGQQLKKPQQRWKPDELFSHALFRLSTHTHIYIYRDPCVCDTCYINQNRSKKTTYEIATSHHSWTFTERSLLLPTESKSLGSTAKLQASCLGMAAPRYRHGIDANPQDFPLAMANLKNNLSLKETG